MPCPSFRAIFIGLFLCLSFSVQANPALKTGVYVREGGSGTLTLKAGEKGELAFSLDAIGVNAHTCSLEGKIRNGKALMKDDLDGGTCTVTFTPHKNGIEVEGKDEDSGYESGACRYYCGMRASFGGRYLTPPPGCAPAETRRAQQDFQRFYDAKAYRKALATLKPVLDKCRSVLDELYEEGRIRNDLAVTCRKLGDYRACYAMLEPYAEDAAQKDEDVWTYSHAPAERETYLSTLAAARVNLMLCEQAEKAARRKKNH
ncbi:hypothetical protein NB640_08815 [Oxalobacter vibrioformis]|uniref:Uncharacterized protein n=1 Tax=Oxalobacter vibrioformis TaxID=933080 RepID=A0A9E9P1Y7_9BURK|nr:hypothetical protein [Oxalobacter vibrioformis]WAW09357.1 hypothetical protein NB640_08815 [Oxalobacter vibrioformis]